MSLDPDTKVIGSVGSSFLTRSSVGHVLTRMYEAEYI